MQVLYPRCAGLDVHKDTVVACVRCVSPPSHHETRSFATTTGGLLALAEWIGEHGCTHVAMEAPASIGNQFLPSSKEAGWRLWWPTRSTLRRSLGGKPT